MKKLSNMVAYLKGLAEGMGLAEDTPEQKLLLKILETLEAFSLEVSELKSWQDETDEYLENMDEDLAELENVVYGDEDEDEDEGDDEDGLPAIDGDGFVEYECPSCGFQARIDITDFDFEEDYLCPRCKRPFFPDDGEDIDGEGAHRKDAPEPGTG